MIFFDEKQAYIIGQIVSLGTPNSYIITLLLHIILDSGLKNHCDKI